MLQTFEPFGVALGSAEENGAFVMAPSRAPSMAPSTPPPQEQLVFVACHDLRAPLDAIQLNVQTMLRKLGAGRDPTRSELIEMFSRLDRLTRDGALLVEDVLTSRMFAHERDELVDLDQILEAAIALHAEQLRRARCDVIVTRDDLLGRARGRWSRTALTSLFSNLLQNVARHAPGAPVRIGVSDGVRGLSIRVSDRGPGLPCASDGESCDHVSSGGHGLGLWLIRRAVAQLRASLEVQNEPGHGLTYHITLPFDREQ